MPEFVSESVRTESDTALVLGPDKVLLVLAITQDPDRGGVACFE